MGQSALEIHNAHVIYFHCTLDHAFEGGEPGSDTHTVVGGNSGRRENAGVGSDVRADRVRLAWFSGCYSWTHNCISKRAATQQTCQSIDSCALRVLMRAATRLNSHEWTGTCQAMTRRARKSVNRALPGVAVFLCPLACLLVS